MVLAYTLPQVMPTGPKLRREASPSCAASEVTKKELYEALLFCHRAQLMSKKKVMLKPGCAPATVGAFVVGALVGWTVVGAAVGAAEGLSVGTAVGTGTNGASVVGA